MSLLLTISGVRVREEVSLTRPTQPWIINLVLLRKNECLTFCLTMKYKTIFHNVIGLSLILRRISYNILENKANMRFNVNRNVP